MNILTSKLQMVSPSDVDDFLFVHALWANMLQRSFGSLN